MKLLNFLQDLSSKMKSIMLDSSGDDSKINNIVEPEIVESNESPILDVNDDLNKQVNGTVGEMNINNILKKIECVKSIFMNVYFRSPSGNLTEIDVVLVTSKAIFVIESKNHKGSVYGTVEHANWIEYYGNKKYRLYNPIMQNDAHISALWNSIGAVLPERKKEFIFSIVVFSDECTLKVTSNDVPVIKSSQLLPYINSKLSSLTDVFNSDEMEYICNLLNMNTKLSDEIKGEHLNYSKKVSGKKN